MVVPLGCHNPRKKKAVREVRGLEVIVSKVIGTYKYSSQSQPSHEKRQGHTLLDFSGIGTWELAWAATVSRGSTWAANVAGL
jgi:hypothetical protein